MKPIKGNKQGAQSLPRKPSQGEHVGKPQKFVKQRVNKLEAEYRQHARRRKIAVRVEECGSHESQKSPVANCTAWQQEEGKQANFDVITAFNHTMLNPRREVSYLNDQEGPTNGTITIKSGHSK